MKRLIGISVSGTPWLAAVALLLGAAPSWSDTGQLAFATPQQAADAFVVAVARNDRDALTGLLGGAYRELVPEQTGDGDLADRFLSAWSTFNALEAPSADVRMLAVGERGWTLPVPIVRGDTGWRFDTVAARELIRVRRIGRHELSTMQALMAYHDAQVEYAQEDHDGDGVLEYAQRFISSPGQRDGLYWPTADGEPDSPLGPRLADRTPGSAYFGYHYQILTAQGSAASDGERNYVAGGNMTGGFAILAWPAEYGDSGVMSFMMARDGVVHQADLGPDSTAVADRIEVFDPGPGWSVALDAGLDEALLQ